MTARQKLLLVFISGIALIILLVVLFEMILFLPIQSSHATLLDAKLQLAVLEKKNQLLYDLERTLVEKRPQLDIIDGAFLTPQQVVEFIQTLERAAAESNIDLVISSAEIATGESENPTQHSNFSISATGNFTKIYEYITLLENTPYRIEIEQASFDSTDNGTVRANITLSVLTSL